MILLLLVVVEDPVTLATQVPTVVTQDQRLSLTIIMVITQRLGGRVGMWSGDITKGEVGGFQSQDGGYCDGSEEAHLQESLQLQQQLYLFHSISMMMDFS